MQYLIFLCVGIMSATLAYGSESLWRDEEMSVAGETSLEVLEKRVYASLRESSESSRKEDRAPRNELEESAVAFLSGSSDYSREGGRASRKGLEELADESLRSSSKSFRKKGSAPRNELEELGRGKRKKTAKRPLEVAFRPTQVTKKRRRTAADKPVLPQNDVEMSQFTHVQPEPTDTVTNMSTTAYNPNFDFEKNMHEARELVAMLNLSYPGLLDSIVIRSSNRHNGRVTEYTETLAQHFAREHKRS